MAVTLDSLCYIDTSGFHFADFPTYLQYLKEQVALIYGADVYLEADSQDGQLLTLFAQVSFDAASNGSSVYNSFSPATAQGVGLSRNVKINGISRRIATNSTADLVIVGVTGTTISDGVAIDAVGQKWILPTPLLIPIGGTMTVTATAELEGAVLAAANTITGIFTPTLGWQTVNNPDSASVGVPIESDAELRARQVQSTAIPSLSLLVGTEGAVANVTGVSQVRGYENDTEATDANGLPAHSISLVVVGGDSVAIAQAIQVKKTPGTTTYGTTSETVFDSKGMPLIINFFRPTVATISAELTIAAFEGFSSDFLPLIKQAIADTVNAFGIGNTILYSKLFIPAYLPGTSAGDTYDIVLLEIKKNAGSFAAANIDLDFNEVPECDVASISITVT